MTSDEFEKSVQALMDQPAEPSATATALPISPEHSPSTAVVPAYSHAAMVQLMVEHPDWNSKQFAAHFGRGKAWFSSILASDSFQLELDKVRSQIADPALSGTMDERFRGLALHALEVLHGKLDSKEVADQTVLKAAELGVKALGLGQMTPPPPAPAAQGVDLLAERLVRELEKQRRNVKAKEVEVEDAVVIPNPSLKGT